MYHNYFGTNGLTTEIKVYMDMGKQINSVSEADTIYAIKMDSPGKGCNYNR
jgi:hypothetical protein